MRKGHLNFHISVENQHLRSPKINHQNTVVSARKHDSPLIEIAQEFARLGQKNRATCPTTIPMDQVSENKMRIHVIREMYTSEHICNCNGTNNYTSEYIPYENKTYILSRDPLTLQKMPKFE